MITAEEKLDTSILIKKSLKDNKYDALIAKAVTMKKIINPTIL